MENSGRPLSNPDVIARTTALARGISESRLRHPTVQHPMRGLHSPSSSSTEWDMAAAWARHRPGITVNSLTAARYWGFRLPLNLQVPELIHLNRSPTSGQIRRTGIIATQHTYLPEEVREVEPGVTVTSPVRTLYEIMAHLPDRPLIAAADGLVNHHDRGYDVLDRRLATLPELHAYPRLRRGARGIRRFGRLMQRVRVGSDSVPETILRLACEDHGIDDLVLGHAVYDDDGRLLFQSDLAHLPSRTSIQYEGKHHSSPEQMRRDIERTRRTLSAGWKEVRVSSTDLQQHVVWNKTWMPRAVALIAEAITR